MLAPGDSMEADIESLLSEWQEAEAMSDDGTRDHGSLQEQQRMMASWRALVTAKERSLLSAKRKELAKDSGISIPAYLTGWLVEGEELHTIRGHH